MKPIMMMRKMGLAAMALLLLGGNAPAQTGGVRQGAAQKDAAQQYGPLRPGVPQRVDMQWWQDSHYGLFLHMGLYTVAGGEWKGKGDFGEFIQLNNKIPVAEMREEAKRFNPVQFDANEWVAAARRAGMKYIVMGSKHHEGFAMFDSPCNDFNVVKATPFGRDIIGELAAACQRQGMPFGVYYSLGRDWDDPDCPSNWPREGGRSNDWDYPNERAKEFSRYFERKAMPQVLELLRQYPNISILWFDTPGYCSPEQSQRMIDTIQKYRPGCLINDRVGNGLGDFITPEQTVSGGLDPDPWESCITIGSSWGYTKRDTVFKSPEIVARLLTDIVSKGGNLLLNIGPTPWGTFPEKAVANLDAVGRWLGTNGEAVYGTRPWRVYGESFVREKIGGKTGAENPDEVKDETAKGTEPDIRFTKKDNVLYVFARSWKAPAVRVQDLLLTPHESVKRVSLLGYKGKIDWKMDGNGIEMSLPGKFRPEVPVYVYKLEL